MQEEVELWRVDSRRADNLSVNSESQRTRVRRYLLAWVPCKVVFVETVGDTVSR
jgi:hypothetical protein